LAQSFGRIVIEIAKLPDYCLSDIHPRGPHKALIFRSKLRWTAAEAGLLRQALLDAARDRRDELRPAEADACGRRRFVLDFEIATNAGSATIRSAWIVVAGEDVLRFVTCFAL
jgi:hypothetical protein